MRPHLTPPKKLKGEVWMGGEEEVPGMDHTVCRVFTLGPRNPGTRRLERDTDSRLRTREVGVKGVDG